MKFLLPAGIGDSVWALHKIQSVRDRLAPGEPIDVYLSGGPSILESRALDFVRRFSFVNSAEMRPYAIHPEPAVSPEGYYNYLPDGWYEFPTKSGWGREKVCALMPNGPLERGVRLESWLPDYPICWDIWDDFRIPRADKEFAEKLKSKFQRYCVFYPGPLRGNTTDGHNRGPLWKPQDWRALADALVETFDINIIFVGASYDLDYWEEFLAPVFPIGSPISQNLIGATSIPRLYAVTSRADFVVSYQSGVGIVSTYLGTPTAIFWRPRGDSISPKVFLSFDESMASAWVPPTVLERGTHLPLIYGRHSVDYIVEEIRRRQWVR